MHEWKPEAQVAYFAAGVRFSTNLTTVLEHVGYEQKAFFVGILGLLIRSHNLRSVNRTDSTSCNVWTGVRRTETNSVQN